MGGEDTISLVSRRFLWLGVGLYGTRETETYLMGMNVICNFLYVSSKMYSSSLDIEQNPA
jgi:hypothetical protein